VRPANGSEPSPICIYKVEFRVVNLDTILGGTTKLPEYLRRSRKITTLEDADDGYCFWACMAIAHGYTTNRWSRPAKYLSGQWLKFVDASGVASGMGKINYTGMTIDDIIRYEKEDKMFGHNFAINTVNITSIKENLVEGEDVYVSPFNDDPTRKRIYLNV
jgi:hypothetical protein